MDIHIHVEKKHFYVLIALVAVFGLAFIGQQVIGSGVEVNTFGAWHPLQEVAKSRTDKTSVDQDGDGNIDLANRAQQADMIPWGSIINMPAGFADGTDDGAISDQWYNCSWTGWYNTWDQHFVFKCAEGEYLAGIESVHWNDVEDRRFNFLCCKVR